MLFDSAPDLAAIELRLRQLLPASLYAEIWVEPLPNSLMRVFEHLRTLQHVLHGYMPRQVLELPPCPGEVRYSWQEGTLLFTDLAGFTPLMEANAAHGQQGALLLLDILNRYFSEMVEIVSKSGGDLLEFTGDAILVQFLADSYESDAAQAVRAGLRMQRAMAHFKDIETPQGKFCLEMRVGIHTGRFLTADIGTPMRMAHVLLGSTVQQAKYAEGAGEVGRVCLTDKVGDRLRSKFRLESLNADLNADHVLVKDDLMLEQLGEYDITPSRRRLSSSLLLDRSPQGLIAEIQEAVKRIEPLASYLSTPILNLLVESAAKRQISPNFPEATVVFVNLVGFPESIDKATSDEVKDVVGSFSRTFALVHAAVRSHGGILQKVTYHLVGSDVLIYFGVLDAHTDDAVRAARAATAIQEIVMKLSTLMVEGQPAEVTCRIGIASGFVFAAEIGEPRGRREFNILGDPVNTAARLAMQATPNQILVTEQVYGAIAPQFSGEPLGKIALKGKVLPTAIFALQSQL
ncbi:adenylate/guanylate cyclase domain-containing protein [Leptolyngbya sp. FACHB-671]|uniref:adenylate/guanylate cyclase domain-containing protein n=1 Tax=Leptolyngbya sp. FACHB-671 TaxID=2692812 RepID=UPI0016842BE4|nr:adenylate/guanylate cyclase domain-containing protein [Leptolyngbya sp. FACHB-671]MBD2071027.1 adenylate/guanylate cyclase domain-containing protein [Leptolyngbya sp. FACHB-671]